MDRGEVSKHVDHIDFVLHQLEVAIGELRRASVNLSTWKFALDGWADRRAEFVPARRDIEDAIMHLDNSRRLLVDKRRDVVQQDG